MTDTPEAVRLADALQACAARSVLSVVNVPAFLLKDVRALLRRIPELEAERDQLRAELEKVRVPDGWKLVPVEPTPEMIHAVRFAGDPDSPAIGDPIIADVTAFPFVGGDVALRMCRAMLTAAPTPPNADQKGQ